MTSGKFLTALVVAIPVTFSAMASDTKKVVSSGETSVTGIVIDSKTKKPISGVTVSATATKLQGEKEINSNTQGGFKLESVPVNDLIITFEKKGYKTVKKEAVKLKEGELMKLVIELVPILAEDDEEGMESPLRPIIGTGYGGEE
jgi:Carboxypeptidase regulatory-like domain